MTAKKYYPKQYDLDTIPVARWTHYGRWADNGLTFSTKRTDHSDTLNIYNAQGVKLK